MTNPENQSTPLTLDEEQLKAITGGGAVMCCMRGTPVAPHEPGPDPEVIVHQAPAPMGMEPQPNHQEGHLMLGGHIIIENHF